MKFSKIIILVVVLVAAIAAVRYFFFPPGQFVSQKPDLQLTISGAGLIFTGGNGIANCLAPNNNKPYCLRVLHGNDAEITFRLVGQPDWEFSRMQLVPESTAKTGFVNQIGFTPAMQADFYVKINGADVHPDTNGVITLNGSPGVGREFILIDNNNLPQTYDYSLEVCPPGVSDPTQCEPVDPKIVNQGNQ